MSVCFHAHACKVEAREIDRERIRRKRKDEQGA